MGRSNRTINAYFPFFVLEVNMISSYIKVTDAPYFAKGDGKTNDRAAIQCAIDAAHAAGGGTVVLDTKKTFVSGNIVLKTGVTLFFEDGAILKQSPNPDDYVIPKGDEYIPYRPKYGHNSMEGVRWGHTWYESYPLIYVGEGSVNIKITGKGIIDMTPGEDCDHTMHICPIGLYRVSRFEISEVTIQNFSNYALMPYTCNDGIIKNLIIRDCRCRNGDGISLMNSQNIRITGCNMITSDDGIYVFTSYKDPRGGSWWSSDEPQPSRNIEIDHNDCNVTNLKCTALAFILLGSACPDQSLVEASNIYIHDNHFNTMGIWNNDPFSPLSTPSSARDIRFENNVVDEIQDNFFETPLTNTSFRNCTPDFLNGNFEDIVAARKV